MSETPEGRTHRLNKNRGNGVESHQFGHSLKPESAADLLSNRSAPQADWRSQQVTVNGSHRTLGEVVGGQLLHGSPTEFQPGDVLKPGHPARFEESSSTSVSITSDPGTAKRWGSGFVYEIEPIGEVEGHRVGPANRGQNIVLYEGRVSAARVIRKL